MFVLVCVHENQRQPGILTDKRTKIYPNFRQTDGQHLYTHDSLNYGDYIYMGGDVAVQRGIVNSYTSQIIHHDYSMMADAASMNQEASNEGYVQLTRIDRRLLNQIIQAYLLIQLDLCMGSGTVSTPCFLKHFSSWGWDQFPRLLTCFIYLWTNHQTLIGSCGDHCSKCLVVDGHQKCRRRICGFKQVKVDTLEMKDLVVGCCRTPLRHTTFCELHQPTSVSPNNVGATCSSQKKKPMLVWNRFRLKKTMRNRRDGLNVTNCRTQKARSNRYVSKCIRTFGIIALVSNCRIITSFSELYRSETLREIINLFAVTVRGNWCI
jgi:hypothetical protein